MDSGGEGDRRATHRFGKRKSYSSRPLDTSVSEDSFYRSAPSGSSGFVHSLPTKGTQSVVAGWCVFPLLPAPMGRQTHVQLARNPHRMHAARERYGPTIRTRRLQNTEGGSADGAVGRAPLKLLQPPCPSSAPVSVRDDQTHRMYTPAGPRSAATGCAARRREDRVAQCRDHRRQRRFAHPVGGFSVAPSAPPPVNDRCMRNSGYRRSSPAPPARCRW